MSTHPSPTAVQEQILDEIDSIVRHCEDHHRPLELDPARSELFSLFAEAWATGCTAAESEPDLSADGLCRDLADRWGLKAATMDSIRDQHRLPPEQLARMRSLWSIMRMWMEWTFAWEQWPVYRGSSRRQEPENGPDGTVS